MQNNYNNQYQPQPEEKKAPKFSIAIQSNAYQRLINNTLGDKKRALNFVASISSAVSVNAALQECDAGSIISAALLGESLGLSPSPTLGHFYMVPFKDKNKGLVATFILGYKGYIQLAIRSGFYRKLNVVAIKEGELKYFDPLNEEIKVEYISDDRTREVAKTIGYYAMFEYTNGFRKAIYWTKEKMEAHADKYSPAFSLNATTIKDYRGNPITKVSYADFVAGNYAKGTEWLYSSFWYKDFDGMAFKTMLRQLIGKWGIMSIEMRKAYETDGAYEDGQGNKNYVDSFATESDQEIQQNANQGPKLDFDKQDGLEVPTQAVSATPLAATPEPEPVKRVPFGYDD